jgi:hypothetical protein
MFVQVLHKKRYDVIRHGMGVVDCCEPSCWSCVFNRSYVGVGAQIGRPVDIYGQAFGQLTIGRSDCHAHSGSWAVEAIVELL